ncbi:MAG: PsiF family protein [Betaproteobacteria bacterium]
MNRWTSIVLAATFAGVIAAPSLAADKAPNAQQQLMKTCNADAKTANMKGDDRKAYMKKCLAGEDMTSAKKPETRMGACNAQAKGMKGDEHKKFMSDCMKKAA